MLESSKKPGKVVSWAQPVLDQMEHFPAGEHDDYVDTVTQCLIYFRDAGFLELDMAKEDDIEIDEPDLRNPYAR